MRRRLTWIQIVTRVLVLATPIVWIAWDVFAWSEQRTEATESHFIWRLALRHWWVAPLLAIVAIWLWLHFFVDPRDPKRRSVWNYWRWDGRRWRIVPTDDNPENDNGPPERQA